MFFIRDNNVFFMREIKMFFFSMPYRIARQKLTSEQHPSTTRNLKKLIIELDQSVWFGIRFHLNIDQSPILWSEYRWLVYYNTMCVLYNIPNKTGQHTLRYFISNSKYFSRQNLIKI